MGLGSICSSCTFLCILPGCCSQDGCVRTVYTWAKLAAKQGRFFNLLIATLTDQSHKTAVNSPLFPIQTTWKDAIEWQMNPLWAHTMSHHTVLALCLSSRATRTTRDWKTCAFLVKTNSHHSPSPLSPPSLPAMNPRVQHHVPCPGTWSLSMKADSSTVEHPPSLFQTPKIKISLLSHPMPGWQHFGSSFCFTPGFAIWWALKETCAPFLAFFYCFPSQGTGKWWS